MALRAIVVGGGIGGLTTAIALARKGIPVTLLEQAEWLAEQGRGDEGRPFVEEARQVFERLQARPWLDRVRKFEGATAGVPG